jgi:hypothetical protein
VKKFFNNELLITLFFYSDLISYICAVNVDELCQRYRRVDSDTNIHELKKFAKVVIILIPTTKSFKSYQQFNVNNFD